MSVRVIKIIYMREHFLAMEVAFWPNSAPMCQLPVGIFCATGF